MKLTKMMTPTGSLSDTLMLMKMANGPTPFLQERLEFQHAGVFDDTEAKDTIQTGEYAAGLGDLTVNTNDDRETNLITALLGKVANMSWMGEVTQNITGEQADQVYGTSIDTDFDIEVDSSGISGTVTWTGHESF